MSAAPLLAFLAVGLGGAVATAGGLLAWLVVGLVWVVAFWAGIKCGEL